ncbi:hypothetical protein QJS10_CPB15g00526 [Acorus calamus]|uniref:Uncharacterized protein n=1 Tax=Acorus calamus TaxID=4465 RepID=A0AAV9D6Z0_ACOCL|nr:hypothetical protein QJS10_CPB15g00526 [Acorus calamus]
MDWNFIGKTPDAHNHPQIMCISLSAGYCLPTCLSSKNAEEQVMKDSSRICSGWTESLAWKRAFRTTLWESRGSWAHHRRRRRRRWRLGKWSEEIQVQLRENLGHSKSGYQKNGLPFDIPRLEGVNVNQKGGNKSIRALGLSLLCRLAAAEEYPPTFDLIFQRMSNNKAKKGHTFNTKHRLCNKLTRSLARDIECMRRDFGLETCIVYYSPGTMVPKALPSREAVDRAAMRLFGLPPPPPPPEVEITEDMLSDEDQVWLDNAVEEYMGGLGVWSEERRVRLRENLGRIRRGESMEWLSLEEQRELEEVFMDLQEKHDRERRQGSSQEAGSSSSSSSSN